MVTYHFLADCVYLCENNNKNNNNNKLIYRG